MIEENGRIIRDTDTGEEYPTLSPPRSGAALPNDRTTKHLRNLITQELLASEADRKAFVEDVETSWRDYRMAAYDPKLLPMADMTVIRTPLTMSRVDQAVGSIMMSLNLQPFATAEVDAGQNAEVAHHAGLTLSQELRDVMFPNILEAAATSAVVTGTGVLKDGVVGDRLAPDAVPIQDLYLSPHAPRDIEQCTLVAHRYYEPLRWVRDQAIAGLFDKDAVRKLTGTTSWAQEDGGKVEREEARIPDGDATPTLETGRVELLDTYIRVRPKPTAETEMWRCVVARDAGVGVTVLRAELWTDGFPFTLLRVNRNTTIVYGNGYAKILRDTQFATDMMNSAALEADFAATSPYWEVDETSATGKLFKARAAQRNGAVRPRPGEIFWRKGTAEAIRAIHVNPAPPAIADRLNRFEAYANVSTIPVVPMQTYRSATEHRFAQANVSAKENMMLGTLRADLTRFLTRCATLYRKYIAEPWSEGTFKIVHGSLEFGPIQDREWNALRWSPTGVTSQADQMLRMSATQEVMPLVENFWGKLPVFQQISPVALRAHWQAHRLRLEALGIQEWKDLIGEDPVRDTRVTDLNETALQGAGMLMGVQQAMQGMQGQAPAGLGTPTNPSPTVPPGGAPLAPGAPGEDAGGWN